jgi:dTDP-4-dehydrorhamnose reductase
MKISELNMIKKRIMIIGSNGLLGQRLVEYYWNNDNVELFCSSVEEQSCHNNIEYIPLDITSKNDVRDAIKSFYPDVIVNAAAYTSVDGCESEKDIAWKINVDGVENLAKHSIISDAHLIQLSTDYIFDGSSGPYDENALPNPLSYYGRTKLASENLLKKYRIKSTVIRINVLYGPAAFGKIDFVRWVVDSLRGEKVIKIVTDQINNPTFTEDLAAGINSVIELGKAGIYNMGGQDLLSRYEFTKRIAAYFELDNSLIEEIYSSDLNLAAQRPLKSGLINLKAETELNYKPRTIEQALKVMKRILDREN